MNPRVKMLTGFISIHHSEEKLSTNATGVPAQSSERCCSQRLSVSKEEGGNGFDLYGRARHKRGDRCRRRASALSREQAGWSEGDCTGLHGTGLFGAQCAQFGEMVRRDVVHMVPGAR